MNLYFFLKRSIFLLLICNQPLFSEEKIVFLHIPKTGGVTVSSLLMNRYSLEEITGHDSSLYSYGNHSYYYHFKHMSNEYKFVTFLRNPIDRVLSEQRYCIDKHHGYSEILKSHLLPAEGCPINTASNVACKMLSGLDPKDPSICIESHLESAKEVLANKFHLVGLTEKMEESVKLLYSSLGWPEPEEIPVFNKTYEGTYSQEVRDGIAERNWADIELYKFALDLFERQKIQIMSNKNQGIEKEYSFYDSYNYTFDQKLNGWGWCLREATDGIPYRWISSQNRAAIDFFLNADDSFVLKCDIYIQPIFISQFRISVNGVYIDPRFEIKADSESSMEFMWMECVAQVPQDLLKKGEKTRFVFEMITPNESPLWECYEMAKSMTNKDLNNFTRGHCAFRKICLKIGSQISISPSDSISSHAKIR